MSQLYMKSLVFTDSSYNPISTSQTVNNVFAQYSDIASNLGSEK